MHCNNNKKDNNNNNKLIKRSIKKLTKDPWGNERAAFTATTKINRKNFGLTWNKLLETGGLLVGEDVMITIEVEGIKK